MHFIKAPASFFICRSQRVTPTSIITEKFPSEGQIILHSFCELQVKLKGIPILKSHQNASGSERLYSSVMTLMST